MLLSPVDGGGIRAASNSWSVILVGLRNRVLSTSSWVTAQGMETWMRNLPGYNNNVLLQTTDHGEKQEFCPVP